MSTTKETAAIIRKAIKTQLGHTAKEVSVRAKDSSVNITVKFAHIMSAPIEELARGYARISRCERTGEILGGGNLYINVSHDWRLSSELFTECKQALLDAGYDQRPDYTADPKPEIVTWRGIKIYYSNAWIGEFPNGHTEILCHSYLDNAARCAAAMLLKGENG
jgi:hypothetical protein